MSARYERKVWAQGSKTKMQKDAKKERCNGAGRLPEARAQKSIGAIPRHLLRPKPALDDNTAVTDDVALTALVRMETHTS